MPELPEVEAWRRALDEPVRAFPIERAGPAHIATLKTFDPPLSALEGRRLAGAERRAQAAALPDRRRRARAARPPDDRRPAALPRAPARRARRRRRSGSASRAAASSCSPRQARRSARASGCSRPSRPRRSSRTSARRRSASAPERLGRDPRAPTRGGCTRSSATSGPIAGIGRAWANEILQRARLSPFALSTELDDEEVARLAAAIDEELSRGLELRERGAKDAQTYRIHNRLGEPCPDCGTPIARVDYEEHTIYYCPRCQTGGRVLKDRRLSRLLR